VAFKADEETRSFEGLPIVDVPASMPSSVAPAPFSTPAPSASSAYASIPITTTIPAVESDYGLIDADTAGFGPDPYAKPAWQRKQEEQDRQAQQPQQSEQIASKEYRTESFYTTTKSLNSQGSDVDRNIPAYLRRQMQ